MSAELSAQDLLRLETLFEQAADLPPEQHRAFVARECGTNQALARELELLLEGHLGEDHLGRMQPAPPSLAGTRIGPYRLLQRIGQGGMGDVYEAEQLEPVVRRVALKVIKPGLDSAEVVARFQAERQALARMKHACVAQIHGGGTTEEGRPYFVMELVEGEPITSYCDRNRLSMDARLELFCEVCAGVQHAHQKGVLHRDLKPSNLLVTEEQGRPQAKVIDFGVARATSGRLAEHTLLTQLGQIVGTLEYMSPEQADPGSTDVDTRSDVYSLGVVLYELVCGLMPFDRASFADLPLSEFQRLVRERDPLTPSTRLRRQRDTATTLAPLHRTDSRAWIRQLTGDLDWICLKALERDPARRYASASELAEDVRRHLQHEPVLARRPSASYRLQKFVRRNRLGVSAAALVLLALILGGLGAASGRLQALASERVAETLRPAGDMTRLERLLVRADDELWPPSPERSEAMRAWLVEASELRGTLEDHRLRLQALRERALPWTAEERRLEEEVLTNELAQARMLFERELAQSLEEEPSPECDDLVAARELRVQELEARVSQRRSWTFASDEDLYWHELLTRLVAGLEALEQPTGLLSDEGITPEHGRSVPWRLREGARLQELSLEGAAKDSWERAVRSIADRNECPRYDGLALAHQLGLLPIGRDSRSGLWEFAHLQSGEPAERANDGTLVLKSATGIVLVLLPGGEFEMGSQNAQADEDGYDSFSLGFKEGPPHTVRVPPFFLSKFELTRPQWWRATHALPTDMQPVSNLFPAHQMTWIDADRGVRRLGLELPHEEQWEYAARATTQTVWYTGNEERSLQDHANLFDRTGARVRPGWVQEMGPASIIDDRSASMGPVGQYKPNLFGLHDVHGNVFEWCGNAPYNYRPGDRQGEVAGMSLERIARGGSSRNNAIYARCSARFAASTSLMLPALGIRAARAIDP